MKVEGAQLGEGIGVLKKEQAVAMEVEFQGEAMFCERCGQEVEIDHEIVGEVNCGALTNA